LVENENTGKKFLKKGGGKMNINVEREKFLGWDEKGRPVMPCFVTYISNEKPILIYREELQ